MLLPHTQWWQYGKSLRHILCIPKYIVGGNSGKSARWRPLSRDRTRIHPASSPKPDEILQMRWEWQGKGLTVCQLDIQRLRLAEQFPILKVCLPRPMRLICKGLQLIIRTGSRTTSKRLCQEWPIPGCTTHCYDGINPALMDIVFVTPYKRQVRLFIPAPRRTRASAAKVALASNPSPNRSIAILLKPVIMYRRLVTHNTHAAEVMDVRLLPLFGYIQHHREPRTVTQKKDADGKDTDERFMTTAITKEGK